jgi:hypothetical protein
MNNNLHFYTLSELFKRNEGTTIYFGRAKSEMFATRSSIPIHDPDVFAPSGRLYIKIYRLVAYFISLEA